MTAQRPVPVRARRSVGELRATK